MTVTTFRHSPVSVTSGSKHNLTQISPPQNNKIILLNIVQENAKNEMVKEQNILVGSIVVCAAINSMCKAA